MLRITIVTDAWTPQVNGAVTTLVNTVAHLTALGHAVTVIEPGQFRTWPCPTYPELPLAIASRREVAGLIAASEPDHVLIATEGPLGLAARRALVAQGSAFTTALFTRFHDYLWQRFGIPHGVTLRLLDWFHRPAAHILTPTSAMQEHLAARGLTQARPWLPGVDVDTFERRRGPASALLDGLPRPVLLYVGRVAVEKNVEAFLTLATTGSKVLVGDGPLLAHLRRRHRDVTYLGYRSAREIAEICSTADVLVFPSRTDTFGHVMVEALACGLPVAAYPVRGPLDIVTTPRIGALDERLEAAVERALTCEPAACSAYARTRFDWAAATRTLLANLVPVDAGAARRIEAHGADVGSTARITAALCRAGGGTAANRSTDR
jgi:glycosyltransferase involved in cell wall biosynthesis